MLASKVNQWTLLIGSLPVAFALGGGGGALPLDPRQVEEFVLTASQTLLGVAILADLRFVHSEAVALFVLFAIQFFLPGREPRLVLSVLYLVIAAVLVLRRHTSAGLLWRSLRAPLRGVTADD